MHPDIAMPTDTAGIAFVIGEKCFQYIHGDVPPSLLDQMPQPVETRTGIRERMGFVRCILGR